jgi:hypothetical protein
MSPPPQPLQPRNLLIPRYGVILANRNPDLVQSIGSYVADEEY